MLKSFRCLEGQDWRGTRRRTERFPMPTADAILDALPRLHSLAKLPAEGAGNHGRVAARNWRRWNRGFVIHATEPSADHRHNLGAGKIQVLALSNIARRTPAVVREAIHDAVVCAGKHL